MIGGAGCADTRAAPGHTRPAPPHRTPQAGPQRDGVRREQEGGHLRKEENKAPAAPPAPAPAPPPPRPAPPPPPAPPTYHVSSVGGAPSARRAAPPF
eukprot:gene10238-25977_t